MGDIDENVNFAFHCNPGVEFTLQFGRHWGAGSIDQTWSANVSAEQWESIGDAAPTSQGAFDTACASAMGSWYTGTSSTYKAAARTMVRQILGT